MTAGAFRHVLHADWSVAPGGRWAASASRDEHGWLAGAAFSAADPAALVEHLFALAATGPTLALFDFPIGVPAAFGERTGFDGFAGALDRLAEAFGPVAERPGEIGLTRPFYPVRPGGARQQHLVDGHGVASLADLLRRCERPRPGRRSPGCLFWTLGPTQVGKAALAGWRSVVAPARRRGAALWPFDGDLPALRARGGLVLAESYPADAYGRLGAPFGRHQSKRRRQDRAAKAVPIEAWARAAHVMLAEPLQAALREGFGEADRGGDRFDAVLGLLAALDHLRGDEGDAPPDAAVRRWEGWIFGRAA